MAVDKNKFDIIQVIVPKEITPIIKDLAKKRTGKDKMSPFILQLIIEEINRYEKEKKL